MQQDFDPKHLKALFTRLRKAVGSQEAAAIYLGVSRQRVAQIESASEDHARDLPTWEQVWTLEASLGRSHVFSGLARLIQPLQSAGGDALKEAHELMQAVAALCPLAAALDRSDPASVTAFLDAFARVQKEAGDLQAIGNANVVAMREAR